MTLNALFVVLFHIYLINYTAGASVSGCQLDITKLNERHPIFLDYKTGEIRYPDPGLNVINLKSGEKLRIECPGNNNEISAGEFVAGSTGEISCFSEQQFQIVDIFIDYSDLVCSKRITSVATYNGNACGGGKFKEIDIGFQLANGDYLHQMFSCFDEAQRNVIYTTFNMTRQIGSATTGNNRTSWTEGNFYNLDMRLNNLYTKVNSRDMINKQLGLDGNDERYIKPTGNYYLAKGHLTARTDFIYNAQQQSTFHYINSAPQWQTFNAFNWFYFERNVRTYAATNDVDLVIYTGTYGISTLPQEKTGAEIELYLYVDDNGNKAIPVPDLFWKIVYEPNSQAGIAVLGVNNPYQSDVQKSVICNDVADDLSWLTFDRTKIEAGYIYACRIDDLRKIIPYIPQLKVKNLLN